MVVPPTAFAAMTKPEARAAARAVRRRFVAALPEHARAALERSLAARLHLFGGQPMASYAAMGNEIDPHWADGLGLPLLFPRVAGDVLAFHQAPRDALAPGFSGIAEPPAAHPARRPSIVLVPLVACDLSGSRIGQGAGHYDRTLAALRATGPLTAIGLAWEVQILPRISADWWDQPLDWIATPERLVDCHANR